MTDYKIQNLHHTADYKKETIFKKNTCFCALCGKKIDISIRKNMLSFHVEVTKKGKKWRIYLTYYCDFCGHKTSTSYYTVKDPEKFQKKLALYNNS